MSRADAASLPYRRGVGILLVNRDGLVLVARRIDVPGAWQPPQGGIDADETPLAAARRELREELGTDQAEPIAESRDWLRYELPDPLIGRAWGGRYRGQEVRWFLLRFTGSDRDIDPTGVADPEFDAWRWVALDELPALAVEFKRPMYAAIVAEFQPMLTARPKADAER